MKIIPVIDLLNGIVVHAKKGDRKHYQPIQSQLADSSKPLNIVNALLAYYPFQQLYIADLDAIQKTGINNSDVIKTIARHYPQLELWIDAGISSIQESDVWRGHNFNLILGSENFSDLDNFLAVTKHLDKHFILSLDYLPDGYHGPAELLENTDYWPQHVLLMSLTHVGANQGVDTDLLQRFKSCTRQFKLYAAGGVRDTSDLNTIKQIGYHGALIASALHAKQITAQELAAISKN